MPDEHASWNDGIDVAAVTDIGLRRTNNQDSMVVALARDPDDWRTAGHLFVVADGMGAHAAGELASKLAVDQVGHLYRKYLDLSPASAIAEAIMAANDEIHRRGQANLAFHNMGTTCSALLLLPHGALIAHVGDSRVYRMHDGVLHQLTFDHSLVWEMRQVGGQDEMETLGIPKNVITRSLGPHANVKVDLEGPFAIERDDTFLLCSDGLSGCLSDEEIAGALLHYEPQEAARLMVGMAVLRGAPDNISLIIIKVIGDSLVTRMARVDPLMVGQSKAPTVNTPAWTWVSFGLLLLLAGGLWALEYSWPALALFGLAILVGLMIAAIELGWTREGGTQLTGGRRLGKAPYQKATAMKPIPYAKHVLQVAQQSCIGIREKQCPIDWPSIEPLQAKLAEQLGAGDWGTAGPLLIKLVDTLADQCRTVVRSPENSA